MKKIKVIHIYKDFNVYNGLIEILMIIAQNIDFERFDLGVCVFRYEGNAFGERFEKLGGKIFNLRIPPRLYNEPREFMALYRFLNEYRPDIVQTHVLKANLYGTLAARLARVPIIIATEMTLKDTAPSRARRLRDKLIHPFALLSMRHCDTFMVTSNFIKQQWDHLVHNEKFEVIYPPFNLEKYYSSKDFMAPNYVSHDRTARIGYVGRLSEEKGIHSLLDVMRVLRNKIPNAELVVVGTGPLEDELKTRAEGLELGNIVKFVGYQENVFKILRDLDIFVLPSRSEGCPIVVLEAMAMGLPVVATSVGGTPELVRDGETGILVPFNNSDKMGQALMDLLQDQAKANTMGQRGKELAFKEFHPSKFGDRLQNLYSQLYRKKILLG